MSDFSSKALEEIRTMREAGFTEKQIHAAIDSYFKQLDEEKATKKAEEKKKKAAEKQALEKETAEAFRKIYKFYGIDDKTSEADIERSVKSLFTELDMLTRFEML